MSEVEDKLIVEAEEAFTIKKRQAEWKKWGPMVACLCLLLLTAFIALPKLTSERIAGDNKIVGQTNDIPRQDEDGGITIPAMDVSFPANTSILADMIGFFTYDGRLYVQYVDADWVFEGQIVVGEYLGSTTGIKECWRPSDGYVDITSSVTGDFYAVKGYDPSFMLYMKLPNVGTSIYICNNGITLKKGSDIYRDRLHLADGYLSVYFQIRDSQNLYEIDGQDDVIKKFIQEMNDATFIFTDSIMPNTSDINVYTNLEPYHLYFKMKEGPAVHLRLLKNGYVIYQGIHDVCLQVSEETYNNLLELLDNQSSANPVTK